MLIAGRKVRRDCSYISAGQKCFEARLLGVKEQVVTVFISTTPTDELLFLQPK